MRRAGGVLLLGSATPSLESYAAAQGRADRAASSCRTRARRSRCPTCASSTCGKEFESGNRGIFSSAARAGAWRAARARREERPLREPARQRRRSLLCRSCGHVPAVPALQRRARRAPRRRPAALPLLRLSDADSAALPGVRIGDDSRVRRSARSAWPKKCARLFPRARACCAWIPTRPRASAITRAF